jgi:glyoxalase family protein
MDAVKGIHHVTAIAGDPQQNFDFYTEILGLRLVKRTVNFDDPGTYHFYFGNERGEPGTILTFFPWPGAPRGRIGTGQVTATAFSVPEAGMGYWAERLQRNGVEFDGPSARFDESVLTFSDSDGLKLELVAQAEADGRTPWGGGPVPAEYAIRGLHSATISGRRCEQTHALLNEMGFKLVAESERRFRFVTGDRGPGARVDLLCQPERRPGLVAVGTVHHIAWRAPDDAQQEVWRRHLAGLDVPVTAALDRNYFRSIYFREPGGVLFEIATDPPGFLIDEPLDELGAHLKLPAWLEPRRAEIERVLPAVG